MNPAGARGLSQFIPGTWATWATWATWGVDAAGKAAPTGVTQLQVTAGRLVSRQDMRPGDVIGFRIYDVAERWHCRGDAEQADAAARRAETLRMQVTEVDQALTAGVIVVRMRSRIPGARR